MSPDLRTRYLGFDLCSPVVASAGPMTGDPGNWETLEAAGVGAVVLPSLFEEQIERETAAVDRLFGAGADSFAEASGFLPDIDVDDTGPARHLALVEQARTRLSVPVIASLNGTSPGGWVRYARHLVDAGAHALELNVYDVVVDPEQSAAMVEQRLLELVEEVRAEVRVPLAVKLSPTFTALPNLARALVTEGADGLVLFNRFYQPDLDLDDPDTIGISPRLQLSTSADSRLPLHWTGILREIVPCSLAASSGVHTPIDAVKLLLVGADVVMTTSALLRNGPGHVRTLIDGIGEWMAARDYDSVRQMVGSVSRGNVADSEVYDRANYFQVLRSWVPGRG